MKLLSKHLLLRNNATSTIQGGFKHLFIYMQSIKEKSHVFIFLVQDMKKE